jgi:hypothetical protein
MDESLPKHDIVLNRNGEQEKGSFLSTEEFGDFVRPSLTFEPPIAAVLQGEYPGNRQWNTHPLS